MDNLKEGRLLITRALDLEKQDKWKESLTCYQEGLNLFFEYMKVAPDAEKQQIRPKLEQYMTRAEKIKSLIDKRQKYHEEILIVDGSIGHSYESVFGKYFNDEVKVVKIEDAYIYKRHQLCNFLRFCELLVKRCKNLQRIVLTTKDFKDGKQAEFFQHLGESLKERCITLDVKYSDTQHDRQITLNNGWVFLPGRGLDYFKKLDNINCSIGSFDLDLRPCHETKINIHFSDKTE